MSAPALDVLAGPDALALLRERGLRAADVDVVPAASGGPKWLVLAGLDRVVFGEFLQAPRDRPLHLIGSSIGAWRLACLAQRDPVAALERFEQAYVEQRYPRGAPPELVSRTSAGIVDLLLGPGGAGEVLAHPWARLHVITALCRGALASERPRVLTAALLAVAGANLLHRRGLGLALRRAVFHDCGEASPFRGLSDLPTVHAALTPRNLAAVLLASGSIPLVMSGVRLPDAPEGVYRDGGVLDYHLDLDYGRGDGLVFYPHFYPHVTPGWFDKGLRWRRARANLRRTVILAPSAAFVATLPWGKLPDVQDFYDRDDAERIPAWRAAREAGTRLGAEFAELVASGRIARRARPLP